MGVEQVKLLSEFNPLAEQIDDGSLTSENAMALRSRLRYVCERGLYLATECIALLSEMDPEVPEEIQLSEQIQTQENVQKGLRVRIRWLDALPQPHQAHAGSNVRLR